jgi:excisionase family DNA binding protein
MTTATQLPEATSSRRLGDVQTIAAMLACSPRHVYRLADADRMPRPLRLGTLVRWDLDAIDQWIRAGCPSTRKGDSR